MKRNGLFVLIAMALLIFVYACEEGKENGELEKGTATFSVSTGELKSLLKSSESLDSVTQAVITITKGGSELSDYQNKTIELNNWGSGSYTTKSIELEVGDDYALTHFELKNARNQTLFAAPKAGSDLASTITTPLPISFSVSSESSTQVTVEVISTADQSPQSFGYFEFVVTDATEEKNNFENAAIALADKASGILTTKSMMISESFVYYASVADPFENKTPKASQFKGFQIVRNINELENNQRPFHQLLAYESNDDPESIQDVYDELTGEYTWDQASKSWDYASSDQIIFKFPSIINEQQVNQGANDVVFTVSEYTGTPMDIKYVQADDYNGDVPVSLKFNMTLAGEKVMDYVLSASYDSDGFPSGITQTLKMDDYQFSTEFTNDQAELVSRFEFTKGSQSLITTELKVNGDYTVTSLDDHVIEYWAYDEMNHEDIQIDVADTANYHDWWIEVHPEEVTDGASMSFTLMNDIQLAGSADVASLVSEYEALDQGEWDNQTDKDWIDAIDEYTEFYAADAGTNKTIADVEIYPYEDEETYTRYEWNPDTGTYDEYQETETYIEPMFILTFSDGSKVDMGVYYEDVNEWGFVELQQVINFILKEL